MILLNVVAFFLCGAMAVGGVVEGTAGFAAIQAFLTGMNAACILHSLLPKPRPVTQQQKGEN